MLDEVRDVGTVEIAGFPISCYVTMDIAVSDILENQLENGSTAIAMNPEKVILSMENPALRKFIRDASMLFIDGVGVLKLAEKRSGLKLSRIPGCELWLKLVEETSGRQAKIFVLGSSEHVNAATAIKLKTQFGANVVGRRNGYFGESDGVINEILELDPDLIFVALGSPRQERFINAARNVGVNSFMMGVGGSFDVFVNEVRRAPPIFRMLNLEWFYRLVKQPSRIHRHLRLLKFVYLALSKKI